MKTNVDLECPREIIRSSSITVAIANSHQLIREALRLLLSDKKEIQVIGDFDSGHEAIRMTAEHRPDVLLLEATATELLTIRNIKTQEGTKILLLTNLVDSSHATLLLRAGASGLISKNASSTDLLNAIRTVNAGKVYLPPSLERKFAERYLGVKRDRLQDESLSERETQVARMLALGHTNREIAEKLYIGIKTVDTHRSNILSKLGLRNNSDITRFAIRSGLIEL